MVGAAVFAYGMLATFVHSSAVRNMKLGRAHSAKLQAAGLTLMSGSAAGAVLAGGYGLWQFVQTAI